MKIGEKIRQARLLKGYSQENMAELLQISTTAFGDIERSKTELTISRAQKIASLLDIHVLELFGEEVITPKIMLNSENEMEKLQLEIERLKRESDYWRGKFEELVLVEAYRLIQNQQQREKIGF
ncbi:MULTISPECIES: helix-turn-helix transcriptional regulator [unclassified Arcicella]|uniref:helix-turn-helix domain-containing protein n=1 Tax=unclassified Arcicella TaxID=2644986 RepID=UPI0028627375|nr:MULTISPECIES: helix-turn-helix transcriptional regulator [unclassified Arcicella]MDR6560290.1 transcriptional regulator with XRE-family HTH domain [Arcicella sp. BE51]MDR6810104.1 transcriptional regulator with XRE-family HTH domain [Arcicella sp. BE140]MDR6821453.1 transcriptional regulator with XRE-family HTH domain [Arcicella sp. BE139]